jgi:hypothetical protein
VTVFYSLLLKKIGLTVEGSETSLEASLLVLPDKKVPPSDKLIALSYLY